MQNRKIKNKIKYKIMIHVLLSLAYSHNLALLLETYWWNNSSDDSLSVNISLVERL